MTLRLPTTVGERNLVTMMTPEEVEKLQNSKGRAVNFRGVLGNVGGIPSGEFAIGREIARGGNSHVFSAMWGERACACKVAPTRNGYSSLCAEYSWLCIFRGRRRVVPDPLAMVCSRSHVLVFVERQDRTLADLLREDVEIHEGRRRWFTKEVCLKVCGDLVSLLRVFHDRGLLYGDVKPDNVMVGYGSGKDTISLVDLGGVCDLGTASHYHGTLMTCSLVAHRGQSMGRSSDLEALAYTVAWLYEGLSWEVPTPKDAEGNVLREPHLTRYYKDLVLRGKESGMLFGDFPEMSAFLAAVRGGNADYGYLLSLIRTPATAYPWSGNVESGFQENMTLKATPLDLGVHYYRVPPPEEMVQPPATTMVPMGEVPRHPTLAI